MKSAVRANFIFNSKGEFAGINCGYGHACEQEHGIYGLQQLFGISNIKNKKTNETTLIKDEYYEEFYSDNLYKQWDRILDIDGIKITKYPFILLQEFDYKQYGDKTKQRYATLTLDKYKLLTDVQFDISCGIKDRWGYVSIPFSQQRIHSGWSDSGVNLVVKLEDKKYFYKLKQAMLILDMAIYVDVKTNELMIVIPSKLDKEFKEKVYNNNFELDKINRIVADSDIYNVLQECGLRKNIVYPLVRDNKIKVFFSSNYYINNNTNNNIIQGVYEIDELKNLLYTYYENKKTL